jgi:D-threo-aldose 1-dehydrogenase
VSAVQQVALGRTGLDVTNVALGTAPLATAFWGNDEATAIATVERAYEAGIRLFDTAPLYGLGEAEQRLGGVLGDLPRDSFAVATKVGRLLVDNSSGELAPVFDFSADAVRRSLESSLERLRLDRVDIVHVHDPEEHLDQALAEAVPALCEMRRAGTISAVSVGTNVVATGMRFLAEADIDAMLVAGRLTLLDDSAEQLAAACAKAGVAYLAAGVFNSGVLARPTPGAWFDYAPADDDVQRRVGDLAAACDRHGVSLRDAAIAFPRRFPGVTLTVLGMATPAEVDDNVRALTVDIPDALWPDIGS